MASVGAQRTQIYLTAAQRQRLDELAAVRGASMASLIRDALDAYLHETPAADVERVLAETFGSVPHAEYPDRTAWRADDKRPRRH